MQQNNSKPSKQLEIVFNFIEIVRILLDAKRFIFLTTIAVGAIGSIYSLYFNPPLPPNVESLAVMEIGSYPAPDDLQSVSQHGRILIASMDATTSQLKGLFEMHRPTGNDDFSYITEYDELIQKIKIYELDSQFFKIEVVGATLDSVKDKTREIIEFTKALHFDRLDKFISKKKRERLNTEEKLLVIDKLINSFSEQGDVYLSDIAELKLKEIQYKHDLKELQMHLNSVTTFQHTDIVGEIQLKTNHPKSNLPKLAFVSFLIGFILSTIFVLIRHGLANNYKE